MKLGRSHCVAVVGVTGTVVEVEANLTRGLPGVSLVGMTDTAVKEAAHRVRAAITNSEFKFGDEKVTLALSPATLPKSGSRFDVALALAVLAAHGYVEQNDVLGAVYLGELALDGRVRAVRGVLPAVVAARADGFTEAVVPLANLAEAQLVEGITCYGAATLREVVDFRAGRCVLATEVEVSSAGEEEPADLSDVIGQEQARFALEVAAAGGHHVFLTGPPGIGKTMLAQRLPGILPPLTEQESIAVTTIASVAGTLSTTTPRVMHPPFVAPHPNTSMAALIGGGAGIARPGAVSRAHLGVLFLDECAELSVRTLEALRMPLEEGLVRIARRDAVTVYPARFQLVLSANPCPCAPARDVDCQCPPRVRRAYLGKLSGPLLDRVDIRVKMDPPGPLTLTAAAAESSAQVRPRVLAARAAAVQRWAEYGFRCNAAVPGPVLRQDFRLPNATIAPIDASLRDGRITARGADRALRLAWTCADLRAAAAPSVDDIYQALLFRDRSITHAA